MTESGNSGLRPSRRRAVAASAVCLGHVLVFLAVWQARQALPREAEARTSVAVRLIAERRERAARATPSPPARAAAPRAVEQIPALAPVEAAAGVSTAAAPSTSVEPGQGSAVAGLPGLAASGPVALVLKPQRDVMLGALANPAVNDPRSNSPKPTFEDRIAMGLDPELCVKLERLPGGSVRRSMGRLANAQSAIQNTYGTGAHGIKVCS
ncbi:hypothetical protein [Roseateles sp.]|uniref:hypothetical protein n=1 Tax=Roseateles sp. TaxID=1971397 RepID=UPI003262FDB5